MNLYELTHSYQQIQNMIEDGQDGLSDTLESLNDAIEDKADGYARVIKNIEGQANAIKAEETRLAERRKFLENNAKRLKESLEKSMIQTGNRKIKTGLFSFNIQKNPPSLEVLNDEAIPKNYFVPVKPKLDRNAILQDLKDGKEVPGVEVRQGESLRIR